MISGEVNVMEERNENVTPEQEGYTPRPTWQVWGARIGLVLFILFVIWQIINIAQGNL